jgi:uncharacterized membrane-anchored protein YhcB (DUF1043 family)
MDTIVELVEQYWKYLLAGLGAIVGLFVLLRVLNRPGREEREHAARLEDLKKKHGAQYRDQRPLK